MTWNTTLLRPVQTHGKTPAEFPQEGIPQHPAGLHQCHCVRINFVLLCSIAFTSNAHRPALVKGYIHHTDHTFPLHLKRVHPLSTLVRTSPGVVGKQLHIGNYAFLDDTPPHTLAADRFSSPPSPLVVRDYPQRTLNRLAE